MLPGVKSLLKTRPVYHRPDAAIRGHLFWSCLALVLRQELRWRMQAAVIRDLDRLRETVLELQGKRFAARTRACGKEMGQDRELRGGAAAAGGEARGRGDRVAGP